jgi:hypothetical protein
MVFVGINPTNNLTDIFLLNSHQGKVQWLQTKMSDCPCGLIAAFQQQLYVEVLVQAGDQKTYHPQEE